MSRSSLVLLLAAVFALGGAVGAADKVILTGILSDEVCAGGKHSLPDPTDCTRECVKHGADYVLVVKDKVYTLKPDNTDALAALDQLAGKTVTINGEPENDFIWVLTVAAAK